MAGSEPINVDERRAVSAAWIVAWLEDTLELAKGLVRSYERPTVGPATPISTSTASSGSPTARSTDSDGPRAEDL